jgi:hypothetical protein
VADIRCPATCAEMIAYLAQFDPNDQVWIGKLPKKPQEITVKGDLT